jgi:hypothetical protein
MLQKDILVESISQKAGRILDDFVYYWIILRIYTTFLHKKEFDLSSVLHTTDDIFITFKRENFCDSLPPDFSSQLTLPATSGKQNYLFNMGGKSGNKNQQGSAVSHTADFLRSLEEINVDQNHPFHIQRGLPYQMFDIFVACYDDETKRTFLTFIDTKSPDEHRKDEHLKDEPLKDEKFSTTQSNATTNSNQPTNKAKASKLFDQAIRMSEIWQEATTLEERGGFKGCAAAFKAKRFRYVYYSTSEKYQIDVPKQVEDFVRVVPRMPEVVSDIENDVKYVDTFFGSAWPIYRTLRSLVYDPNNIVRDDSEEKQKKSNQKK